MKRSSYTWMIAAALVAALAAFVVTRTAMNPDYEKRILLSSMALTSIRHDITVFHEIKGRYPESLAELQEYAKDHKDEMQNRFVEFISDKSGCGFERTILDGSGGWCYNPASGTVNLNLTSPLKAYFRLYLRTDRNSVPSQW